jgi:hypothetical protein
VVGGSDSTDTAMAIATTDDLEFVALLDSMNGYVFLVYASSLMGNP